MSIRSRVGLKARQSLHLMAMSALLAAWPGTPVLADPGNQSDAAQVIAILLDEFLANVDSIETHERFWADDLVYTSSAGTRTTKAEILAGMRAAAGGDAVSPLTYSAEDVDIRVFGDAAIVAFRLVSAPRSEHESQSEYFNTGTLLRRAGRWQVVAWQATRIPEPAGAAD